MEKLKIRGIIYLNALINSLFIGSVVNAYFHRANIYRVPIMAVLCIAATWFTLRFLKDKHFEPKHESFKGTAKKRVTNLLCLIVILIVYLIKLRIRKLLPDWTNYVLMPAFFCMYTEMLLLKVTCTPSEKKQYRTFFIGQLIVSMLIWGVYWFFGFTRGEYFVYDTFVPLACIYVILTAIYSFTIRKKMDGAKNNGLDIFGAVIAVLFFIALVVGKSYVRSQTFCLEEAINSVPKIRETNLPITYRDEDGVYEIHMTDDDFKVLQLTDVHIGGSIFSRKADLKAVEAIVKVVSEADPDLVIVTGDLAYPVGHSSGTYNNKTAILEFAQIMRNMNVPWAFTFGNHDNEPVAVYTIEEICDMFIDLSWKTSENLLYPYKQPDIYGRNNQIIEVYNTDGTLNQALVLIDSNSYTGEGTISYDYIHDDQVEWYEQQIKRLNAQEGKTVSSLVFYHIPEDGYLEAWTKLQAGSDEVKVHFGSMKDYMAKNCLGNPDDPSKLFGKIVELGSTKATFVGHDHLNTICMEYKGVRLTFGLPIDYIAYPSITNIYTMLKPVVDNMDRGGVLITSTPDSEVDIKQVNLKDLK
ncbi:MAG: metallophosphoesterase [Eubacteriales bacterium]|nr:metallophosphoesterase [Eubacteriales bacterium]